MKSTKPNNIENRKNQQGVTLLLAILVLSSILAISFSVATILFVEVRTSSDLLRTENSIYASQGVGEEIIYRVKRQVPLCPTAQPNCYSGSGFTATVGRNAMTAPETKYMDAIQVVKVPPFLGGTNVNATNFNSVPTRFRFFNPDDFFNTGTHTLNGSGYGYIGATLLETGNNGNLKIYLCEYNQNWPLDPNKTSLSDQSYKTPPCSDPSDSFDGYWRPHSYINYYSSNWSSSLVATMQQELVLVNTSTTDMYVQITTRDQNGALKGIPFYGEKAVDVNAQNTGVSRKLRIQIPEN